MKQQPSSRTYRLKQIPELENLSIEVEACGGNLRCKINGKISPLLRFLIKRFFSSHSSLGTLASVNGSNIYSLYFPPIPSPAHERLFESFLSTYVFKKPKPMAATIGITSQCQYKCIHCSAAGRSTKQPEMSTEEIRRVIGECLDLGVSNITFTGGEPLLRQDLATFIASVQPQLAVSQVFTNAAALTPERIAEMSSAGVYGLQVSLDSPEPAEHDRLRGSAGAFKAVEKGIIEARRAGLLVGVSTYATRSRVWEDHFLPRMADLTAGWGAQELTVFDAIEIGGLLGRKDLTLDHLSRWKLLKQMGSVNRRYRGKMRAVTQSWTNSGRGFSRLIGCLAGNFQFHITSGGEFTPCDFTPLSFGNIRESSVTELWQKLLSHPAYHHRNLRCRMQNPDFRRKYIETIPKGEDLPYRLIY
ncbi:MAG: radical SAM/SPASM domain-containing protein [Bacillota bacterium]